ncbi:MAG: fibronectin type III domain-containing protein [Spirochaetes bacterium]|nr:fibronectin type III domain-containing protein [Spirochaetota bacterium]
MNTLYPRLIIALILLTTGMRSALGECVFLKNGSILRGKITGETGTAITLVSPNGSARMIGRSSVLRILYTDIYLGKVVVRLTDGSSLEAYLVDENADAYTFRNNLYLPDEYTVPRKKVLFMARTNPTDLHGTADTRSIWIAWYPPYKPPRGYRVYFKEIAETEFRKAGATGWLSYTIRGLKEKTRYRIMVTAIDDTGGESLPTDEIEIMTNTPPDPPPGARLTRLPEDRGTIGACITWRPAIDPDGSVKGYRIYRVTGEKRSLAGKADGCEYTLKGLDPKTTHYFAVRSVDNDGVESADAPVNTRLIEFDVSARGCFLMPVRDLGKILHPGWGGLITVTAANFPAWGLNMGLGGGFLYFTGWGKSVRKSWMAPMLFTINYRFMIGHHFSISPEISAGLSYISISYTARRLGLNGVVYPSRTGVEPTIMAGIAVTATIKSRVLFHIVADYGMIIEKKGIMDFIACEAGAGVRI